MYEQQCTFYFVDKCDLFWVFCRWNPLQLFWTLNLCFTNPVSRSEIFSTKCIAYANNKMISILTDPKWYPARQSLRLDPSAFLFVLSFPCDGFMSHKIIRSYLTYLLWATTFLRVKVSQGWRSFANTSCWNHRQFLLQWPRTTAHMGNCEYGFKIPGYAPLPVKAKYLLLPPVCPSRSILWITN